METQTITPDEFNDKLMVAEEKFMNPNTKKAKIPVILTILPDPYPYKKVMPIEIREALGDSTEGVKIEGEITSVNDVNRFGSTPYTYLFKNNVSGQYFFKFYPKNIPMRRNLDGFNISVDSVSSMEVQMSPYFTTAPLKVESPEPIEESITDPFLTFLESLKGSDSDNSLIESIKLGYRACMDI